MNAEQIKDRLIKNYLSQLVNNFFKILPMKEEGQSTLITYMKSMRVEMLGSTKFISSIDYDSMYMSLLSILQYLIDHEPDISVREVRKEVFDAISICNKLKALYAGEVDEEVVL